MYYLDSLVWGDKTLDEIIDMDMINSSPLSEQVTEEMFEEAFGDKEEEEKMEIRKSLDEFLMNHEMERQNGQYCSRTISVKELVEIGNLNRRSQFLSYIEYMSKKEQRKISSFTKRRKSQFYEDYHKEQRKEEEANEKHIFYGLGANTIHLRMNDKTVDRMGNWNAIREFHEWGQPLVIDLSFTTLYRQKAEYVKSFFQQEIPNSYHNNRSAETPFQLHLTGVSEQSREKVKKIIPLAGELECCFNLTDKHATDIFDPERMVYLSPDSRNDLKEIDPDDIYIIGGMVDKHDRQPLTLSRAKRQGIRHARFPMKRILEIKADLNVETCVAILCDMKAHQDWFYAFRWVPARYFGNRVKNLTTNPEYQLEHELIYRAHRALSPTTGTVEEKVLKKMVQPKQYRDMYVRIMKAKSREEMEHILEELKLVIR